MRGYSVGEEVHINSFPCKGEEGVLPKSQIKFLDVANADGSSVFGPVHDRSDPGEEMSRKWYNVGCVVETSNQCLNVVMGCLPIIEYFVDVPGPSDVLVVWE